MKIKAQDVIDEVPEEDKEEQYQAKVEAIEAKYEPYMKRILGEIKQAFEQVGYDTSEIYDMSDEHLNISFMAYREGETEEGPQGDDVDVSFQVAPSVHFDGSLEGINFIVDVVSVSGEIIGGMTPFNYTDQVWVDVNDEAAVEERFNIFNQTDPEDVVSLVEDFWLGK